MFGLILICSFSALRPRFVNREKFGQQKRSSDPICDICLQVVKAVEDALESTQDIDEVIQLVLPICDVLPSPYPAICKTLVKEYVTLIAEYLEQELEHLEICQRIGLCTISKFQRGIRRNNLRRAKAEKGDALCNTCLSVVNLIEEALESETDIDVIIGLVDEFCDTLPFPISTACELLASEYVPYIVDQLAEGIETLDICDLLGLYSAPKIQRRIARNNIRSVRHSRKSFSRFSSRFYKLVYH
jgi:saposin